MSIEQRTYASFEWDSEDEAQFDDKDCLIAPGGRHVLEQIRGGLRQRNLEATEVEQHEHFGWSFTALSGSVSVWCMIQDVEPWLLITDVPFKGWQRIRGRKPDVQHRRVCEAIHAVLSEGGHARKIRWFSRPGYEQGKEGVDRP